MTKYHNEATTDHNRVTTNHNDGEDDVKDEHMATKMMD